MTGANRWTHIGPHISRNWGFAMHDLANFSTADAGGAVT